jgi:hypothetical protein
MAAKMRAISGNVEGSIARKLNISKDQQHRFHCIFAHLGEL